MAASHTQTLMHAGNAAPAALTGGFQQALWVLGAIALLAIPAIFALVRRDELTNAAAENAALVRAVFEELAQTRPAGFRYAVFQLPDSRQFVHLTPVHQ
ncbi:MAG: hypothetical protein ACLP0J_29125 [Solirubrobacteraceae bacterium]